MSQLLKDSVNKINRFIEEAQISLDYECGFPAILMIFSVILAVSEAIHPKSERRVDKLIPLFVSKMNDKNWFVKTDKTNFTDDELSNILIRSRDGLAHQISLPIGVFLVTDLSDIGESNIEGYDYFIAVHELILSVRKTVEDIVSDKKNSPCCIDGKFSNSFPPRRVASQVSIPKTDGTYTTGSGVRNLK